MTTNLKFQWFTLLPQKLDLLFGIDFSRKRTLMNNLEVHIFNLNISIESRIQGEEWKKPK
jgi:hypothetical protein